MEQFVILVDFWYVRATSCSLLECDAPNIVYDPRAFFDYLHTLAKEHSNGRLLRIYVYDWAFPHTPMKKEHSDIACLNDVYLRLGQLRKNEDGTHRQKWVDWLIVTDLITLSNNKAITDAFIVSWDEDITIGISTAKWMGIRIHLMNVVTPRPNVSPLLIEEADNQISLSAIDIKNIFKTRTVNSDAITEFTILWLGISLNQSEIDMVKNNQEWMLPAEIDKKILSCLRDAKTFWDPIPKNICKDARKELLKKIRW